MRKCSLCETEKEESDFYSHPNTPSGLSYYCKSCQSEYGKRYRNRPKQIETPERRQRRIDAKKLSRKRYRNSEKGKAYDKAYRKKDSKRRRTNLAKLAQRIAETKSRIDTIKLAAGCVDCGYKAHAEALDFDHRDPKAKVFSISKRKWAKWEQLEEEIKKCDLVCANCHRVRTAQRRLP